MYRTLSLVAAFLAAIAGLLVAAGRESRRARSIGTAEGTAGGRVERCVTCHARPDEDPGGAHARAALGCATCHLGNPMAYGKERAHAGLEREPGAFSTLSLTCGRDGCHAREAARLASSPMLRAGGIVSVDRWVFGELPTPDGVQTMADVLRARRPSAAESHLRKLCAGCHLGTRRASRDDAIVGSGSGCAACHVAPRVPDGPSSFLPRAHPPVDAHVPDDRCLGCHSRSGRIALSYAGLAEVKPDQVKSAGAPCAAPLSLHDGRPACRVTPDVHKEAGMACTDCHLHTELMGDGTARPHEEQHVEVTCETCHGPVAAEGETTWDRVDDPITRDLLRLRGETRDGNERVRLGRGDGGAGIAPAQPCRGTPVWNLEPAGAAGWRLLRKGGGPPLLARATPSDANHRLPGHERLACTACHTAWAPSCTTCHTTYDPARAQWDFGAARETPGTWIERDSGFAWGPPALGVTATGSIVPAAPGMRLELDARPAGGVVARHRLFAPISPHTTGRKARACAGCHASAAALGLGSGTLDLSGAEPRFEPAPADDGWTSLFPREPGSGTRVGFRSLDAAEQRRVLAVGTCLPCHTTAADPAWRRAAASSRPLARTSRCRTR